MHWGPEFWDPETGLCNDNVISQNWYIRDIMPGQKVDPDLNTATKLEHSDYIESQEESSGTNKRKLDVDCSGQGTTWGPGIAPPPDGCKGDGDGGGGGGDSSSNSTPEGVTTPPTCFESKCVSFTKNQIIVIHNFAVMTNPKGGGVAVFWDTGVDRLGLALPEHISATKNINKLFDGAHFMLRLRSEDKNTGAKATEWINEFGSLINDNPQQIASVCPATSTFGTVGKAEIYFKPTDIKRTVIDNDVYYSVIGEIGGFLDIIIYAATGLMFIIWSIEKIYYNRTHNGGSPPTAEQGRTSRDSGNVDEDFAPSQMVKAGNGAEML